MNDSLEREGFVSLPGFMSVAQLQAARRRVAELEAEEGENAGAETLTPPVEILTPRPPAAGMR